MQLAEQINQKWSPVLDHPDLPEIKDAHRRAVTAMCLENVESQYAQDQQTGGLLSEAVSFAHIQVDESLPENQSPIAKNEPGVFITVFKKSVNEISEFFNQQSSQGIKFDAKLYSFFLAQGVL